MAEAVGFDPEKIRIIVPYCGGAFGGKDGITVQSLLALAAMHVREGRSRCGGTGRRVFWPVPNDTRPDWTIVSGPAADGTFQALEARLHYDTGPYDHLGGAIMALGLEHAGGPYRIPHVSLKELGRLHQQPP